MMEYLVTLARMVAEDHQDWTDATGPEENPDRPASGPEDLDSLDLLGLLGRRVRKESPDTSQMAASRVYQVYKEKSVDPVSEVLMVHLVFLVREGLRDSLAPLVLPVPQGQWGAVVTDMKERKETRATWVFPDPVVLPATGR